MDTKYIVYALIASAIILVCIISIYYGVEAMKKLKENNEYSYGKGGEVNITIYYVDWCPYSKKALEIWEIVSEEFKTSITENGKDMKFHMVDCEDQGNTDIIVNGKVIEGYPTIYCDIGKDKPQIEFKSKCTNRTLRKFFEDIKNDN